MSRGRVHGLLLAVLLLAVLALLQHGLWFGSGSLAEWRALNGQIAAVQQEIRQLGEENTAYIAEVHDLKHGFDAIEERARSDMGMIAPGEVFYLLIYGDGADAPVDAPVRSTPGEDEHKGGRDA